MEGEQRKASPLLKNKKQNYMKTSRFNVFLSYKEKTILYNTLSERILMLTDSVSNSINEVGLISTASTNELLFDELKSGGFIIENDCNEDIIIEDIIKQKDFSDEEYHIIINPTLDCNFNCWYCFEQKIKGSSMSTDVLTSCQLFIHNIISKTPQLKKITLSFFGGEPLLYYKKIALPIITALHNEIKNKNIEANIHFTTNGYLLTDSIIDSMSQNNVNSFQITFDGNRELHNQIRFTHSNKGSYDRIIDNICKILTKTNAYVILRINYTHQNINSFLSLLSDLKEKCKLDRLILSPNQVWQDKDDKNSNPIYNHEILDEIYAKAKDLGILTKYPSSQSRLKYPCYADKKNQACINFDGNVFKCNARDFKKESRMGVLNLNGEIEWSNNENIWMNSKYQNTPCKQCFLYPICTGGCRRLTYNNIEHAYCMYNYNEDSKRQVVLDMLLREQQ